MKFKKITEINSSNYESSIKQLVAMGDTFNDDTTDEFIKEFEELADLIKAYENKHYPI